MLTAYYIVSFAVAALLLFPLTQFLSHGFSLSAWKGLVLDSFIWRVLGFTFFQAFLSATLSLIVGFTGAFLYSEWRFPGRRFFWRSTLLFFNLPALSVVLALTSFWGESGVGISGLYGLTGILLAHTFLNFPLFVKGVGLALLERPQELEASALSLGASRFQTFLWITVPYLKNSLLRAWGTAFLLCSSSFVVVLLLGGGPKYQTLEVSLYESIKMNFDPVTASQLGLLQMGLGFIVFYFFVSISRVGTFSSPLRGSREILVYSPRSQSTRWLGLLFFGGLMTVLTYGPLFSLIRLGFIGLSKLEFENVWFYLKDSLLLALVCSLISVSLSLFLAYGSKHSRNRSWVRFQTSVLHMPLFLSGIILSTAILLAMPPQPSSRIFSFCIAGTVQALLSLPYVYRPLFEAWERIPRDWYLVARSSGATAWQIFRWVEFPQLSRSLRVALSLAMGFSIGELGVILVLFSGEISPLSLSIFQAMGRYRFQEGYAMGVVLIALLFSLLWLSSLREES